MSWIAKRSHKRIDPDIKAIGMIIRALSISTPRMVKANLEFAVRSHVRKSAANKVKGA